MKKNSEFTSGDFNQRVLVGFLLCSVGVLLAVAGIAPTRGKTAGSTVRFERDMPVPGGKADDLDRMEVEWNNRLTYPTGLFNPQWLRLAAAQDALVRRAVPVGLRLSKAAMVASPLSLSANNFTALGPAPLQMTG